MAKTIHTILLNDSIVGSRIVSMDNCVCQLYIINRGDDQTLSTFSDDLTQPALYILLNDETHQAYIGETDNFKNRLQTHASKKDFWTVAMAFFANDKSLTKTEVQYLENLAYTCASDVQRYALTENTQSPKNPHMQAMQRIKSDDFFRYVQILAQSVGCYIFGAPILLCAKKKSPLQPIYYCKGKSASAQGYFNPDTEALTILAGSILEGSEVSSYKRTEIRHQWLSEHATLAQNHTFVLNHDVEISSLSTAANLVLGRPANGWDMWKDANGTTIAKLFNH